MATSCAASTSKSSIAAKEKVKVERKKRWSEKETFTLCEFVKENRGVLFGTEIGHGVAHKKKKAWEEAGKLVEGVEGVNRGGPTEIRAKWNDLVYRAKKYRTKRMGKETGGGPQETENKVFDAVLQVLPDEVVSGILNESIETTPVETKMIIKEVLPEDLSQKSTIKIEPEADIMTASSQDSVKSPEVIIKSKKRRAITKEENKKKPKEMGILDMNAQLIEIQKKQLLCKELELKQQKELIDILKVINGNIEKLVPPVTSLDLNLLDVSGMEQ